MKQTKTVILLEVAAAAVFLAGILWLHGAVLESRNYWPEILVVTIYLGIRSAFVFAKRALAAGKSGPTSTRA